MKKKFGALLATLGLCAAMLFGVGAAPAQAYPGFTVCQHYPGDQYSIKVTWETRAQDAKVRARAVYVHINAGYYNYRNTSVHLYINDAPWPDADTAMWTGYPALYSGTFFYGDGYYLGDPDGSQPWVAETGSRILWISDEFHNNVDQNIFPQMSIRASDLGVPCTF